LWLVMAAGLLATAGHASAASTSATQDRYEIPLPDSDTFGYSSPAVVAAKAQAEGAFSARNGGTWKVYSWNPQTGTPNYLYGSGVQAGPAIQTPEDAVEAARAVMQANPTIFRADPANLRLASTPHALGKWAVHFQQTYHGIDVWGGRVHLTFTEQGRLFVMGSQYYPGITVDPSPSIPASVAEEIARRALPIQEAADSVEGGSRLLVLPVPLHETEVEHHLVWQVRVRTQEPLGVWVTHVDAHTGQVVWRYNDIQFADFVGTTQGMIERPSYCEGQAAEALPYLRIQIAGVGTTYADAAGNWRIPYGGTAPHPVTVDLYGPYVDVNNAAGPDAVFNGIAVPGIPLQVSFSDANAQRDERDVYQAIQDLHNFYETFAPGFSVTNARFTISVSQAPPCGYGDLGGFYQEGDGCANTGQIMSLVHHECGHVIQNAILGSQGTQGLGEGNSDLTANLVIMESIVGRGYYLNQCTSGLRDSDNNLHYPEDVVGQEIHSAGRVIAGFHWDAMELLIQQLGTEEGRLTTARTWHWGRVLEHPTTQPDQVLATFIADDDDGDLTNGTPHYDAFCTAAANHGFNCPEMIGGLFISHLPIISREQPGDAAAVAAIWSTEGPLMADSLRLNYRISGDSFQSVGLAPTGGDNEFSGEIPDLQPLDEVEYYLRAMDQSGNATTDPVDAPANLHGFDIATEVDSLEAESGWTVNLEGTDDAGGGIWVRADPVGTTYNGQPCQPEDDHTPDPGITCWITGNGSPGGPAGEQDVDLGTTTVYSPVYGLSGSTLAKVKYHRWYTNDLGNNPHEDAWRVQVRNNGGPWIDLENTTASANQWTWRAFDLAALFGTDLGNVQLKFVASDLGNSSLVEAAVDDFELLAQNLSGAPEDVSASSRFALLGSRPNPALRGSTIAFQVPTSGPVRLSVYDVSGRLVRVLADRSFEAGAHQTTWDGTDDRGRAVASGAYYCRMEAGGFKVTRSVVLSR
jgi:hypothetical protein